MHKYEKKSKATDCILLSVAFGLLYDIMHVHLTSLYANFNLSTRGFVLYTFNTRSLEHQL